MFSFSPLFCYSHLLALSRDAEPNPQAFTSEEKQAKVEVPAPDEELDNRSFANVSIRKVSFQVNF